MRKFLVAVGFTSALLGALVAGCGSSSNESYCCVNGAYYSCKDADTAAKCVSDTSVCTRDSSKDDQCSQ